MELQVVGAIMLMALFISCWVADLFQS